jgi:maltose alpha-D-glucosyltransferase/alpha-amylase
MSAPEFDAPYFNGLSNAIAAQLPDYLRSRRWFRAKAQKIHSVTLADCIPVALSHDRSQAQSMMALVRVEFAEGREQTYVLPLLPVAAGLATEEERAQSILSLRHQETASETLLCDALANQGFLSTLLEAVRANRSYAGHGGEILARATSALPSLLPDSAPSPAGRILTAEQSNTSIVYGDRLILKFYRSVEEGINPDLEIGQFLTEKAHFPHTPALGGSLEYQTSDGKAMTLGILQAFVPNQGDAWSFTLRLLRVWLAQAIAHPKRDRFGAAAPVSASLRESRPTDIAERLEAHVAFMGLLGRRTAEMHCALASGTDPAFLPEPFTPAFRESLQGSLHDMTVTIFDLLRLKSETLAGSMEQAVRESAKLEEDVLLAFHAILEKDFEAMRTRIHGDYHLGQVLFTGSDFLIIDFEGEPARPIQERRAKRSPLQDVAGILRSFHYAEHSAYLEFAEGVQFSDENLALIRALLPLWRETASKRFLAEYRAAAGDALFLPKQSGETEALLRLHLLEKAVYELGYELNNRPAWLPIPLHGIQELIRGSLRGGLL